MAARMSGPGYDFVEAYNSWQSEFAYQRLNGWNGAHATQPAALERKYTAMLDAFDRLSLATTGTPRPNYFEIAKRRIQNERRGGG